VHTAPVAEANEAIVRLLVERWNAGDVEGTLALYHEDAVQRPGPEWPEQQVLVGHEQIAANMESWREAWQTIDVEVGRLETHGDKVVGQGEWKQRGRISGVEGSTPFSIVFTLRDGKIAVIEWFTDHDSAVAAARDA
jgi:ketosteroid isomerase-like protein